MPITLTRIELREIRLPLREAFRISSGMTSIRRILLLRLVDGDGAMTWSECTAGEWPNYSPETVDTAWLAIKEWVAPRLLNQTFEEPQEIHDRLDRDFRGHNMAKAAVEMGVWALVAQRRGLSLAGLLGGTREKVATGISLGIQEDPDTLAALAARAFADGYRKVKCKIAPGADLEYIAAAREALGPDGPLMADANSAYTLADADRLTRLDEFDLLMIEQPLAHDDLLRHADLQRRLRTPICLDESITSADRARDMLQLEAGRIINIKPGRLGGYKPSLEVHDLCAARDVPVWHGGMLESGVGRAYNVALASLPNFRIAGDLSPSARYWERDIVTPEWTMDADGMVTVPRDRPSLGIDVDLDYVEDLTVRSQVLTRD